MKIQREVTLTRNAMETLMFQRGIFLATLSWLTLLGNIGTIKQVFSLSFAVLDNQGGIADVFVWFAVLLCFIIVTPKILNFGYEAEEFFIKFYTVIINAAFSIGVIYCLYFLIVSNGYIQPDPSCVELSKCGFIGAEDFHYINSLLLIVTFLWLFSYYINRLLPAGYLNYASMPPFVIVCLSVIFSAFSHEGISLYNYFTNNPYDGLLRMLASLVVVSGFLIIIRRTVFASLQVNKSEVVKPAAEGRR